MKNNPSESNRAYLIASLLVLIAAICFSSKAVMVKLAYRYEIDSISLLALRMLFSLPFYLVIACWSNLKVPQTYALTQKDKWQMVIYGLLGYYLASFCDFTGLQYITAGLERIILFVYPTMVLILSAIFLKKKIETRQYIALLLTYIGIGIALLEGIDLEPNNQLLIGTFWVFLAALSFAIHLIGSGDLLPKVGTLRYTSFVMIVACIAVVMHTLVVNQLAIFHFQREVYLLGILLALVATVFPSFLIMQGIKIIGAGNAAIIGSIGPISTIALAYIFLDERLGNLQWLGTFLVIGGVLMISLKKEPRSYR